MKLRNLLFVAVILAFSFSNTFAQNQLPVEYRNLDQRVKEVQNTLSQSLEPKDWANLEGAYDVVRAFKQYYCSGSLEELTGLRELKTALDIYDIHLNRFKSDTARLWNEIRKVDLIYQAQSDFLAGKITEAQMLQEIAKLGKVGIGTYQTDWVIEATIELPSGGTSISKEIAFVLRDSLTALQSAYQNGLISIHPSDYGVGAKFFGSDSMKVRKMNWFTGKLDTSEVLLPVTSDKIVMTPNQLEKLLAKVTTANIVLGVNLLGQQVDTATTHIAKEKADFAKAKADAIKLVKKQKDQVVIWKSTYNQSKAIQDGYGKGGKRALKKLKRTEVKLSDGSVAFFGNTKPSYVTDEETGKKYEFLQLITDDSNPFEIIEQGYISPLQEDCLKEQAKEEVKKEQTKKPTKTSSKPTGKGWMIASYKGYENDGRIVVRVGNKSGYIFPQNGETVADFQGRLIYVKGRWSNTHKLIVSEYIIQ